MIGLVRIYQMDDDDAWAATMRPGLSGWIIVAVVALGLLSVIFALSNAFRSFFGTPLEWAWLPLLG